MLNCRRRVLLVFYPTAGGEDQAEEQGIPVAIGKPPRSGIRRSLSLPITIRKASILTQYERNFDRQWQGFSMDRAGMRGISADFRKAE